MCGKKENEWKRKRMCKWKKKVYININKESHIPTVLYFGTWEREREREREREKKKERDGENRESRWVW